MKSFLLYLFLLINLLTNFVTAEIILPADIVEGQDSNKNYIKEKAHFEKNVNGWSAYADAAATRPVDGTGGSPTITCTRSTTTPITGDGSLIITKDAANRQGQGCAAHFTIGNEMKAKVMQIEIDYRVVSGTFTAGTSTTDSDLIVYIYDVTNSTLIEPTSIKFLSTSTTIPDKMVTNFQTSATGTTYKLIIHHATTSASAFVLMLDNIKTTASRYVYGTPISDWVSWTPTGSWTGAVTYTGYKRRVGSNQEYRVKVATSGAPTGTTLSINLAETIDTTKISSTDQYREIFGDVIFDDTGTGIYYGKVAYNSSTSVSILTMGAGGTYTNGTTLSSSIPFTYAAGDSVIATFTVPIQGWSSSVQQSDGYDGRQIAASYTGTSGTITVGGTRFIVNAPTKVVDKTSAVTTGASWKFTAPSSGTYQVNYVAGHSIVTLTTGASLEAELYKNGSFYAAIARHFQQAATAVGPLLSGSLLVELNAGDYIDVRESVGGSVNATISSSRIDVYKLQAPTIISATELTQFYTYTGSPTGTLSGSYNTVTYGTSGTYYDTHGAYSAGVYTLRKSGCFDVKGSVQITHTTAAGFLDVGISFKGAAPFVSDYKYVSGGGDTTQSVSGTMCGKSGDNFRIQVKTNLTTPAYSSGAAYNYFILSERK